MLFCVVSALLEAQGVNLGVPPVWNYSKKIYKAGTQNWDAAQDNRGAIYFANNEGLLQFDGSFWHCYPVANRTVVRSVEIAPDGKIFVGAQSELGYFFPDLNGRLRYHSLLQLLPEGRRRFEDVWDIECRDDGVFFRTNQVVFQYTQGQIRVYEPGGYIAAMMKTPAGLVIQRDETEILRFDGQTFVPLLKSPLLQSALTACIPISDDSFLLTSLKNGIFSVSNARLSPWQTPHDARFAHDRIYSATALSDGQIALGTSLNGLLVLDRHKRIFRHLSQKNGLQNNNILHIFNDKDGNLWLGLDSGIDCAALQSPFTTIFPDNDLKGAGYAALTQDNQLYLGVSNGLYRTAWSDYYDPMQERPFQKIAGTDGQVWSLDALDRQVLVGHHEGAFQGSVANFSPMSALPGAWTFVPMNAEYMIGGAYNGLSLYRKTGGRWIFDQHLNGLEESCRFLVKDDDGALWMAHPYRGVYRIEWRPERKSEIKVQFFNAVNGLPSDLNNLVFSIAGKAVFATEKGVYRFDRARAAFFPDAVFNQVLGKTQWIKRLQEDRYGNIWYVGESEVGLLQVDDIGLVKDVKKRLYPTLLDKLVGGFELIYPVDENNVFFGAERGFIHFNAARQWPNDTALTVLLSQISANGESDTLLMGGWLMLDENTPGRRQSNDRIPVLNAHTNNLRFAFAACYYSDPEQIQYRYRLLGLTEKWSEWSSENTRSFTQLSPGKYTFEVQSRRKDGVTSAPATFSFRIRPPWYAGTAALALYSLTFLGIFVGYIFRQQRKFQAEKEQMTEEHQQIAEAQQREVERSKAALNEMRNEKLEAEIQFKNQELASATMHLVQKGEILLTIQENLNHILEKSTNPAVKKEIQQLLNLLNFDATLDDDWQRFAFHFDQVHVDFLRRLRENYPQLSANDHKLCAYLRMNLSTKEIAPMMNISVRGVEASRYRLRKKLGLPNDANLTEWVLEV